MGRHAASKKAVSRYLISRNFLEKQRVLARGGGAEAACVAIVRHVVTSLLPRARGLGKEAIDVREVGKTGAAGED